MKNQYFGDTRDLFKYDLVLEILLNTHINHFTFIPMLTPNEPSKNGGKTNYEKAKAGTRRTELKNFLEECIKQNKRNTRELERFFGYSDLVQVAKLTIYKKNEYFCYKKREEYFEKIPTTLLRKSVILVDPDNGLEIDSIKSKGEKYIMYEEVKSIFTRMDKLSVLIIFQFIPRVKREEYFLKICKRLKEKVFKIPIYYLSDNQVVFYLLTKDKKFQTSIGNIIQRYGKSYNLIVGKGVVNNAEP